MKEKTLERFAYIILFILGMGVVTMFVLLSWGFVEFIQWLTSK